MPPPAYSEPAGATAGQSGRSTLHSVSCIPHVHLAMTGEPPVLRDARNNRENRTPVGARTRWQPQRARNIGLPWNAKGLAVQPLHLDLPGSWMPNLSRPSSEPTSPDLNHCGFVRTHPCGRVDRVPGHIGLLAGSGAQVRAPFARTGTRVSVIIATRESEEVIRTRVENALAGSYPGELLEVIVAIDAQSHMATPGQLGDLGARVLVIRGDAPGGKAATLNAAARLRRGSAGLR